MEVCVWRPAVDLASYGLVDWMGELAVEVLVALCLQKETLHVL